MTQYPDAPQHISLAYETPPPHGNAPTLVRLAVIFTLVTAGIDLLYGIGMICLSVFMYFTMSTAMAGAMAAHGPVVVVAPAPGPPAPLGGVAGPAAPGPPLPPAPLPPPMPPTFLPLMAAIYAIPALLSLTVMPVKIIGGVKLLRRGKNAWGWGLAGGIVGTMEIWMLTPCCVAVIPISAGIYTIVILSLTHVRTYINATAISPPWPFTSAPAPPESPPPASRAQT